MSNDLDSVYSRGSHDEKKSDAILNNLLLNTHFDGDRLRNLPLFMRQKDLAHILALSVIYQEVLSIPGYIAEFGLMYGRNFNLFHCLRECYEPLNHTRKLIGFDSFEGFLRSSKEDLPKSAPREDLHKIGAYAVPKDWELRLASILEAQEAVSHLSHLRRFEIVRGDVAETLPAFLEANPHAIFALCYLDLDLYEPTRAVLEAIAPRLTRGSILVFDEVCNPEYPGETAALEEVFGLRNIELRRLPLSGWKTYFRVDS